MDYKTKGTSVADMRRCARILRRLFHVPQTGPFPVLEVLDKISDVFKGSKYEIVDDSTMPPNTVARCFPNDQNGYTIEIKETIYVGAFEKQQGAFLGFICHEICHVFLFYAGFTPIFERSFKDNELPAYCSVEWQAKALCSAVMMPIEETRGMDPEEIIRKYHVSKAFANRRGRKY